MAESFSTNLGLPATPLFDQAKYPDIFADSLMMRNALTALQTALDKKTGAVSEDQNYWNQASSNPTSYFQLQNVCKIYAQAGQDIPQSALCTFTNVSGVLTMMLANASSGTPLPAYCYCNTANGVKSGAFGEFVTAGMVPLSGAVPGTKYYLDTTAGAYNSIAPSAVGTITQMVGVGAFANFILFNGSFNWKQN